MRRSMPLVALTSLLTLTACSAQTSPTVVTVTQEARPPSPNLEPTVPTSTPQATATDDSVSSEVSDQLESMRTSGKTQVTSLQDLQSQIQQFGVECDALSLMMAETPTLQVGTCISGNSSMILSYGSDEAGAFEVLAGLDKLKGNSNLQLMGGYWSVVVLPADSSSGFTNTERKAASELATAFGVPLFGY